GGAAALCRGALRPRGPWGGADVLHRAHARRAAAGADADPRIRRRSAAAVPDLRREARAVLPGAVAARAHLVALCPVRLGAAVALLGGLRRGRAGGGAVRARGGAAAPPGAGRA